MALRFQKPQDPQGPDMNAPVVAARASRQDGSPINDVTNQSPPLSGGNAWRSDPLLVQISEGLSEPVQRELDALGRFVQSPEAQETARLANTETPQLRTHDRQGRRVDLVEFHPAYHALMRRSVASGLHSSIWENGDAETGRRHQARAVRFYLSAQLECGHLCPVTMTSAALAASGCPG